MSLASYSGVVINHNGPPRGDPLLVSLPIYQTFTLPPDYVRGEVIPPLTGFQVFAHIVTGEAATASLTWTLDRALGPSLWTNLASGTTVGSALEGNVWFSVAIDPVPVDLTWLDQPFRIGIQGSGGLDTVAMS